MSAARDAFLIACGEHDAAQALRRGRIAFNCYFGAFVITAAFLFGLSNGLSARLPHAHATLSPLNFSGLVATDVPLNDLARGLPKGVAATPMGEEITINGKPASVVMFSSNRAIKAVVEDQVEIWKGKGLFAVGAAGSTRGVGIGLNRDTGERFSIIAWKVPEQLKRVVGGGSRIQGIVASADAAGAPGAHHEEMSGEVPGVPLTPGGRGGSVFSSLDRAGRSYSGAYTSPSTVEDTMAFYVGTMRDLGWALRDESDTERGGLGFGSLRFERDSEEVILLFSPVPRKDGGPAKTLVTVARGFRERTYG